MIKLFRRIRKSFIEKNQIGNYLKYAVGEILLVVLGILIALQINNWNEKQKQLNFQNEQLSNLSIEIEVMKKFLFTQIGYFELALAGNKAYLEITESKVTSHITLDSISSLFNLALNTDFVTGERLSLETKIDFNKFRDQDFDKLEQKLIDWRHFAEKIGADFQHIENNREIDLQRAMFVADVPGWSVLYNNHNPDNFSINHKNLLKSKEVYGLMYYRLRRMQGIIEDMLLGIDDLNIMLAEIQDYFNSLK